MMPPAPPPRSIRCAGSRPSWTAFSKASISKPSALKDAFQIEEIGRPRLGIPPGMRLAGPGENRSQMHRSPRHRERRGRFQKAGSNARHRANSAASASSNPGSNSGRSTAWSSSSGLRMRSDLRRGALARRRLGNERKIARLVKTASRQAAAEFHLPVMRGIGGTGRDILPAHRAREYSRCQRPA